MLKRISCLSLSLLLTLGVLPVMPVHQSIFAHTQVEEAQRQEPITVLSQNLIERQIAGGQQHTYSINLEPNQFLFLDVQQLGIDVVIQLIDADGKLRIETNAPDLAFGAEPFYWVAEKVGTYNIVVKPAEASTKTGKYTIKVGELRPAKDEDFHFLDGQNKLAQGEKLRAQGKKENLEDAITHYKEAIEHWRKVRQKEREGVCLNLVGFATYFLGDIQAAIGHIEGASKIREGGGKAQSVSNLGSMYLITGEKVKALESFSQGLKLSKEVGDKITQSNSLNGIGNLYYSFGDQQNALNSYSEALSIAKETGDKAREAGALHNVGTVFASVGDFDKAISYFRETLPIWDELKDTQNKLYTLNYLGHVYRGLQQYDTALSYYNQVLEVSSARGQKRDQAITLVRAGQVYYLLHDYNKALEVCNKALEISTVSTDLLNQTTALDVLGSIYSNLGNEDKALEYFTKALEQAKTLSQQSLQADLYYNLARSNKKLGNLALAVTNIEKAIELSEKGRSRIANRDLRTYYFATTQDFNQLHIDLLMALHDKDPSKNYNAQALYVHELSQARTLLDLIKESRIDIHQGVDGKLLEEESELKRLTLSKTETLVKVVNKPNYSQEERTKLEREIYQLDTKLEQVQGKIRDSSPNYAAIQQPKPLALQQIQKEVLDDDTTLLEYSLGKESSYLWVVTNKSLNSYKLPSKEEIEKAANPLFLYYKTFFYPEGESELDKKRSTAKEQLFIKAANNFSKMILGDVANQLGSKRLLIIPDGILQYIPFAGLPDPNKISTELYPLIAEHEVVSMPSASTMGVLRSEFAQRKPASKPVIVFGDPIFTATDERLSVNSKTKGSLIANVSNKTEQKDEISLSTRGFNRADLARLIFSGQEATSIGQIYKDATIRLGSNADLLAATSSELINYRFIHFATHGFFNSLQPELSGLVLSLFDDQGKEQNGYLTANHIYNLKLNAELVVLSACQTGFGKQIRGEGILGLTRGFLYAGAERVMFTLWNVNDKSTSIFMTKFYSSMKEGLTPSAALRQAQISMWKDKKWSTPFYWAAFQLQGEWQKK